MRLAISRKQNKGLTVLEISVVLAVLLLLACLILPALYKANQIAHRFSCTNNLKQVGLSFRTFANDHDGKFPMQLSTNNGGSLEFIDGGNAYRHFLALSKELSTPKILVCPADKRKALTNFAALNNEHVSYFVGLDAVSNYPTMLLGGDRNITNEMLPNGQILLLMTNQTVGWTKEIHEDFGNVVLADDMVEQMSSSRLQGLVRNSGVATNRLAIP